MNRVAGFLLASLVVVVLFGPPLYAAWAALIAIVAAWILDPPALRAGLRFGAVLAIVFAAYGIVPAPTAALLPLVWLPLLLLVAGLGFGLALANGLVRDVSNALSVALGLFFFLVPVVVAAPAGWLTDLNPVAAIIVAAHDLVVVGHLTRPLAFAGACTVSLVVLPAGWWTFRAAESLVAERI